MIVSFSYRTSRIPTSRGMTMGRTTTMVVMITEVGMMTMEVGMMTMEVGTTVEAVMMEGDFRTRRLALGCQRALVHNHGTRDGDDF